MFQRSDIFFLIYPVAECEKITKNYDFLFTPSALETSILS